ASAGKASPSVRHRRRCRGTHRRAASAASRPRRGGAWPGATRDTHTGTRSRTIIRARLTIAWALEWAIALGYAQESRGARRDYMCGPPVTVRLGPFVAVAATLDLGAFEMAKLVDGFKDGRPELGRRTFLVPENHAEVLALLYHEQTGIVGGLPVGPVTTDPFGSH